ncbi:MAG: hypothetical protein JWM35_2269 [Verrucomicrobia bacterium]|nr:hypothetical protein [Verrucomicrobiota bacterium]
MFNTRGPKISEELGGVLITERTTGFQFHDQGFLDEQVGEIAAKDCTILILDLQGMLLRDGQILGAQTMSEAVFIDLFQVTGTEKLMKFETGFTDEITKTEDIFMHAPFLARFAPFRGSKSGHNPYFSNRR